MNPVPAPTPSPRPRHAVDDMLLTALQTGLPIVSRPFARLGEAVGLTEAQILERVRAWFASGLVRRFGAVFDAYRLGYTSTLCAAAIPTPELEAAAARLTPHPGVTHCYEREGDPNLWFTLTAPADELADDLAWAADALAPHDLLDLPAIQRFKIEAVFRHDIDDDRNADALSSGHPPTDAEDGAVQPLDERERRLVRCLQGNLPLVQAPYEAVARTSGYQAAELLTRLQAWRAAGIIRRIAVVVRHRAMGFTANCMCVWNVPSPAVRAAGAVMARHARVTHCYERRALPAFPYNLYAMMHAGNRPEVLALFRRIEREAGLGGGRMLWSAREFKKTSPVFFGATPQRSGFQSGLLFVAAGSSCPLARAVFDRIRRVAETRFPGTPIRWAFTSRGVRQKLLQAGIAMPSPDEALGAMRADGIDAVAVVSLHLSEGMEYGELRETVNGFRRGDGATPMTVVLGRALLTDASAWRHVLQTVVRGLPAARSPDDAVVLVAHGSKDPRGAAGFAAASRVCRRVDRRLFLGMMLGHPSFNRVLAQCRRRGVQTVWLAPCLVAAGHTVRGDIAGPDPGSWKSRFEQAGIRTVTVFRGLGDYDAVVDLWMNEADRLLRLLESSE